MKYVLDTHVLVGAMRSPTGASAEILRRVLSGRLQVLCSVPLFLEYGAVLSRPEQLEAAGLALKDVVNLLDVLAGMVQPVDIAYLWRPQLRDMADDMVLEAAVNGQAKAIVTFNLRDFLPQTLNFGIAVINPAQFFKGAK